MTKKEALLREALKLQDILNTWGNVLANGKPAADRMLEVCAELKLNHGITGGNIDDEINELLARSDMKLKGNYDIDESGRYTVIFKDENGEEWEVEFELWVDKQYIYEETGKFLTDVNVQAKCMSPGFSTDEEVEMEMSLQEYITDSFNL